MARMHEVVEFVKRSKNRLDVLKALGESILTSNKIAGKTHLGVKTVRSVVNDLRKKGLVKKAVRKNRRPMVYGTTKVGKAVLRMKDFSGRIKWKGTNRQKRISRTVKNSLHKL